jgi:hypothetical protein
MGCTAAFFALLLWVTPSVAAPQTSAPSSRTIDRIAARIEDDIILESEVSELGNFQRLVDGRARSREEVIRELLDQWIVRNEAANARFAHPGTGEVDEGIARLTKQFGSPEAARARIAEAALTQSALRRLIEQQLYLTSFIDYKFRPAAQVDPKAIDAYYRDELTPPLQKRGEAVPPIESVQEQIREVLIERNINQQSTRWLDETRSRLRIDIAAGDNGT